MVRDLLDGLLSCQNVSGPIHCGPHLAVTTVGAFLSIIGTRAVFFHIINRSGILNPAHTHNTAQVVLIRSGMISNNDFYLPLGTIWHLKKKKFAGARGFTVLPTLPFSPLLHLKRQISYLSKYRPKKTANRNSKENTSSRS